MKRVLLSLFIVLVLGFWFVVVAQDKAFYVTETRNIPPVVLVRATVPENAQICAETITGGIVGCRPVSEFRKWVKEPLTQSKN